MPNTAVGLQTVFGTGVETVYGTPVTPTRWYGLLPGETLERRQNVLQGQSIFAGGRNVRRGEHRALTHRWGEGTVPLEVMNKGFGRWFEHILGGTPAITGAGPYQQVFEMGSLTGKSLTIQKGLRDQAGATREKFTFHGCKCTTAEFTCAVGEILRMNVGIDAEDVDDTTALAAHTYTTGTAPFQWAHGAVAIEGVNVAKVMTAGIRLDNALKTDSFFFGTGGLKGEPEPNDFPTVTGTITMEFDQNDTVYDLYAADSGVSLELDFDAGADELTILVPEIHFTGETPKVGSPGVITLTAPFEAAYDGTNKSMKITYVTSDAAA